MNKCTWVTDFENFYFNLQKLLEKISRPTQVLDWYNRGSFIKTNFSSNGSRGRRKFAERSIDWLIDIHLMLQTTFMHRWIAHSHSGLRDFILLYRCFTFSGSYLNSIEVSWHQLKCHNSCLFQYLANKVLPHIRLENLANIVFCILDCSILDSLAFVELGHDQQIPKVGLIHR